MDPFTHAASGAIAMLAIPSRPVTWFCLPLAALACASPDLDLLFIHSPLEFLLLHRGISHSLAASPVFGLLLALLFWPLWRKQTPGHWQFWKVCLFCTGMIWLHIWLDIFTTYGTMIFLPFSHYRMRLNSLYIIDPFLTIPLFLGLILWRTRKAVILAILLWVFIYPAGAYAINLAHSSQNIIRLSQKGYNLKNLAILPDALAPFFWRLLYEDQTAFGSFINEQSLNFRGQARTAPEIYKAGSEKLINDLQKVSTAGKVYFQFALMPLMVDLPDKFKPDIIPENAKYLLFYDLRFGSNLEFMRYLLSLRPNADMPFLFMAEILPQDDSGTWLENDFEKIKINRVRLRFSDSGKDSGWHYPEPPKKPDFLQWLVGLE